MRKADFHLFVCAVRVTIRSLHLPLRASERPLVIRQFTLAPSVPIEQLSSILLHRTDRGEKMINAMDATSAAWQRNRITGSMQTATSTEDFLAVMQRQSAQTTGTQQSVSATTSARTRAVVASSVISSAESADTGCVPETAAVSLEDMLQARYPGIHYHVFDASSSHWKTRNDYPHYLLYQDGDAAKETLENWKPEGENPFYGSIDGRFIAPNEIKMLGNVPPGSKAVVIHPKVQERMNEDPTYAQEIFNKIEAWFAFDTARNEAILPGSTWDNAQAVAIGEDGNICNACASSPGGDITQSESPSGRRKSWWDQRMARHADYMQQVVRQQIQHSLSVAQLRQANAAKANLADMIRHGNLLEIFGSEISGVPTEEILGLAMSEAGMSAVGLM